MIDYVRKQAEEHQARIDQLALPGILNPAPPEPTSDRRRETRFEVTAKVELIVFVPPSNPSGQGRRFDRIARTGITRDLSRRGACVELETGAGGLPCRELVGRDIKLRLRLATGGEVLNLLGRVCWGTEQKGAPLLGLEFTEVPELERRILDRCCRADDGDLCRIMNLWQLMVGEEMDNAH